MKKIHKKLTSRMRDTIVLVALLFILGFILWLLFDTHIIKPDAFGNLRTGESTYGDLPFHLSTISQTAYAKTLPPENPFYAGLIQTYPYFINLLTSVFVLAGVSTRASIITTGMFFSLLSVSLLFLFYKKISKDRRIAFFGALLFFLNGGLGVYYFFRDIVSKNLINDFLINPGPFPDYSHVFSENIQWPNYLSRIIVPERSVLLGIPMGIVIIWLLFLRKEKEFEFSKWTFFAAVLTGLLPFSHTHTFMVFALLIPFLALFELKKTGIKKWLLKWIAFGGVVLLVAGPQLYQIIGHVADKENFVRFRLGWMSKPGAVEFFSFWFKNTFLLLPLMALSLFIKGVPIFVKRLILFSFFIFILINLFIFQPYDWDNVKFMFWFGIFGFLASAFVLVNIWDKYKLFGKALSVIIFLAMISSALISIYREIGYSNQIFSREDVEMGIWVKENTPAKSIFLTAPIHNSFVSNLGGRRIFMGYPGLLWVHGINYSQRERDLIAIYSGSRDASYLLSQNKINYVVIGPGERNDLKANAKFFEENYCLVKDSKNYEIFDVGCRR